VSAAVSHTSIAATTSGWIDRRGHVVIDDLKFSPGGLVCDGGYFSLHNFAAMEADPDASAYAVIHIVS
jgi:hypothetical protein